jgi:hypothetical protein
MDFFKNLHFGSLRNFFKCHFLSAPSFFFKRRRRMRGMKVSVIGDADNENKSHRRMHRMKIGALGEGAG